jgi:hypothetical protein
MSCKNMHSKLKESSLETLFFGQKFSTFLGKALSGVQPRIVFWHLKEISHKSLWLLHIHCIMCR